MSPNTSVLTAEVKKYSDQELREKLTGLGMDVGPITGTTRSLYERKLVHLLQGTRSEFLSDSPASPSRSSDLDDADGSIMESLPSPSEVSEDSTIHLIRARKPLPRTAEEETYADTPYPVRFKSKVHRSPFPAADAQFRQSESPGSLMDHLLKFALFGIVMTVIVYLISNQDQGKALEHKN